MSKKQLLCNALIKYIAGLIIITLLLFLPAGTVLYPNGWLFIALLFVPMLVLGMVLFFKAPDLLEKRLNAKEKRDTQDIIVKMSGLAFFLSFIMAGVDYRFRWSQMPEIVVTAAAILLLVSYGLYAEVMRENTYLSRTIEVQENQKVIDTGLYGIVRHPMYMATIFLFLSIPFVLGSWVSFVVMLVYPAFIIARIKDEELLLEKKNFRDIKNTKIR